MPKHSLQIGPLDAACAGGFLVYSASAAVTPIILVTLLRVLEIDLAHGGLIETVRNVWVFVILFASGFFAARWGKVRALAGGSAMLGLGLLGFAFAPSYTWVMLAAMAMGLGAGIQEGLINPLVQELHPADSGRYLNWANAFWSLGVLGTVIISGELLTRGVHWRLIVGTLGVCSLVVAWFFWFHRRGLAIQKPDSGETWRRLLAVLRPPRFWLFMAAMFLAGAVEIAFLFWSASLIQLVYDGSARAAGWGTACFAVGMMGGRLAAGVWVPQQRLIPLLMVSSAVGILFSACVPFAPSLAILYLLLFIIGLAVACLWPTLQSVAAEQLPVDHTWLFILLSCGGIPGFAVLVPIMGGLGDAYGLSAAFFLPPVLFLILSLLLRRIGRTS